MTTCTHTPRGGARCPFCGIIVADDASSALLAASGAVSLEGSSTREGSRPATIATGVASDRKAGDGLVPVRSGPGSPIADPATPTVTPCPVPLAAARDTLSAQAHTVAGSAPHARLTDPDTAHEAAASVTDVQRRKVYQAVLEALVEHGPSTDHDLARYVTGKLGHPIGQTSVGKRRGELRDAGYVCDSGYKGIVRETGARAIRWGLTPAGIDAVGVAA